MTNTNQNTRRAELIACIEAARRQIPELEKKIEQNRQFIAESRARVIESGRRMFHCFNAEESSRNVTLWVYGRGMFRLDATNDRLVSIDGGKDLCWDPLPRAVKDLLVELSLVVEELRRRVNELSVYQSALENAERELSALDAEELPPPPATITIEPIRREITLKVKTTDPVIECAANNPPLPSIEETANLCAEVDAIFSGCEDEDEEPEPIKYLSIAVVRFDGYDPREIDSGNRGFEAMAHLRATYATSDGSETAYFNAPVWVEKPWFDEAHKRADIINNMTSRAAAAAVLCCAEDDPRVDVNLKVIKDAVDRAFKCAELPELEARRYCHGVIHALEVFDYLEYTLDDDFDAIREALFADDQDAAIAALTDEQRNALKDGLEYVSSSCFDGDYNRFRDHLREAIDGYFLEVQTAVPMVNGELDAEQTCVKAVVTCGGPYCAIQQFFGETPRVVYRTFGGPNYETPLSCRAASVFDAFIEPLLY